MIKTTNLKQRHEDLRKTLNYNSSPTKTEVLIQDSIKKEDLQNGGGVAGMQELDTVHKKLLVEQWSRESKKNYML